MGSYYKQSCFRGHPSLDWAPLVQRTLTLSLEAVSSPAAGSPLLCPFLKRKVEKFPLASLSALCSIEPASATE